MAMKLITYSGRNDGTKSFIQSKPSSRAQTVVNTYTLLQKFAFLTVGAVIAHVLIYYHFLNHKIFATKEITKLSLPYPTRTNVLYGHLHFPKTGGSNLNGLMASTYDNVCGNKGYSYDFYQFNKRGKESNITDTGCNYDTVTMAYQILKPNSGTKCKNDGYGKERRRYDRGKPGSPIMDEIGYENCDYLSNEIEWKFWFELLEKKQFHQRNFTLELHVPCREPIDHFMSIANMYRRKFHCPDFDDDQKLRKAVKKAYAQVFNERITQQFLLKVNSTSLIQLKCFSWYPLKSYVDYMGQYLQPRRIPVEEYWPRDTNKPRNKTKECIWSQSNEYREKVLQILKDIAAYFRFCQDCMGSKNELKL